LAQTGEPTGSRLVSVHNLAWTISLMKEMKHAIQQGTFSDLKRGILDVWA